MERTTIEASADGNILITRQAEAQPSGNARQRRQQVRDHFDGLKDKWYKRDRVILRPGKDIPDLENRFPGVQHIDNVGSSEAKAQAFENDCIAGEYGSMAEQIVQAIDAQVASLEVSPATMKRARIVWE